MLVVGYLVFLLCQANAEPNKVIFRCSDDGSVNASMTFTPSQDAVKGRYTAELCKLKDRQWTDWKIDLSFNRNFNVCRDKITNRLPGPQHSSNTLDIRSIDMHGCTRVCLATDFDLIFSSCYQLQSTLKIDSTSTSPDDFFYIINNNITRENVLATDSLVSFVNHDEYASLDWILGIPPVDFNVMIQSINKETNELSSPQDVTSNCSAHDTRRVSCSLAPAYGWYQAKFTHGGPWIAGTFNRYKIFTYEFYHKPAEAPRLAADSALAWWLLLGALLLGAALAAGLALHRVRDRTLYKRVMEFLWTPAAAPVPAPAPAPRGGDVLLLYAREGEAGRQLVAALKDLVQCATGARVFDIYSGSVLALAAPAPHGWLRGMLAREGVRVLLLQTPALELLRPPLQDCPAGPRLQAPLLGRAAVYREPAFGDSLLQTALQLVAETPQTHNDYHKFFLATVAELETELLPSVVPFRRYVLEGAAPALAGELAGLGGPAARQLCARLAPQLRALGAGVRALQRRQRDLPAHLAEELLPV